MAKRRRRWSRQEKADIVQRFFESGLPQGPFAESVGVHRTILAKWISLSKSGQLPAPTPTLLPVRLSKPARTNAAQIVIVLANGRKVLVPVEFEEEALSRVIQVLEKC